MWRQWRTLADGNGDPLDLLHDLVDSSLLVADAASGRYRVLFIVRAFLTDLVVALGEADASRERFLARCVVVAREISEGGTGPDEPVDDRRLRAELDNLRAARDVAREHGDRAPWSRSRSLPCGSARGATCARSGPG